MAPLGKSIALVGVIVAVCGLVIWMAPSIPIVSRLGRLPGDLFVRRGNATFYFPLTTSILISIVASLLFAMMRR